MRNLITTVFPVLLLILGASAVSCADVLLKKLAADGITFTTLRNPHLGIVIILYLFQIAVFLCAFAHGWKLTIVSVLQIGLYAIVTLVAGIWLFHEPLSSRQIVGACLTLLGAIFLSL